MKSISPGHGKVLSHIGEADSSRQHGEMRFSDSTFRLVFQQILVFLISLHKLVVVQKVFFLKHQLYPGHS